MDGFDLLFWSVILSVILISGYFIFIETDNKDTDCLTEIAETVCEEMDEISNGLDYDMGGQVRGFSCGRELVYDRGNVYKFTEKEWDSCQTIKRGLF